MTALDKLMARERGGGPWTKLAFLAALMIAAALVWSWFTELDEVAIAEGVVVPRDQVKVIQHLEGGIIKALLIEEGDRVEAGTPLIEIELPMNGVNAAAVAIKLDGLVLARARLRAELSGEALALPEAEARRRPDQAASETESFSVRRDERQRVVDGLQSQIRQARLKIDELTAAKAALRTDLGLARQNLKISSDLVKDRLTPMIEHLNREREVKRLEGEIASLEPAIPGAEAALQQAQERLAEQRLTWRRQVLEELSVNQIELARTREVLGDAERQAGRRVIASPIAGTVKNLRYHTLGGVIRPADPIMEIVPADSSYVIEAKLSPADRGMVRAGLEAAAKISTYDFLRYGALNGRITRISADSTQPAEGEPYFRVVMTPDRGFLERAGETFDIMPGMIATVDIKVGHKSVLEHLLRPLARVRQEAFRERL